MTERMIDVPGGKIWTNVVGDGPGAPLLILHGGPGMPSAYLNCLADMASDRPVIFYDQLGCGRSDRPTASEGYFVKEHFVNEIDYVRDNLGLSKVHLIGHSWGGLLATLYMNEQPYGIQSITFASPLISVSRWIEDCNRLKDKLPSDISDTINRHEASNNTTCPEYAAANFEWWRRHVCTIVPFPEDVELALNGMGTECYETMWGPTEFRCTGNLLGMDGSVWLGKISCPTLFTCGRYDEATPEVMAGYAELSPYSEFHIFENSSHMAHLEEPEAYLACLRRFLTRVDHAAGILEALYQGRRAAVLTVHRLDAQKAAQARPMVATLAERLVRHDQTIAEASEGLDQVLRSLRPEPNTRPSARARRPGLRRGSTRR